MADVDTTTAPAEVPAAKDLKEKKEVVEEAAEKTENGKGDAPANGTEENGAEHSENTEDPEEEEEEAGEGEGDEEEEEGEEETEADGHPVKRPAEEEKDVDIKKQKTENGDSTKVKEVKEKA